MDQKNTHNLRLLILAGFLTATLLVYLGVLYNVQVNQHEYYQAQSIRTIAREERVEASRGVITDRSGRPLVSNRSTYALTFDTTLLKSGEDANEAILRLLELLESRDVAWNDNLPLTRTTPVQYDMDSLADTQRSRFLTYLRDLKPAREALGSYLYLHPELVKTEEAEAEDGETPLSPADQGAALLERLTAEQCTPQLLTAAGISPSLLVKWMREALKLPEDFSPREARLVLGIQYELAIRKLIDSVPAYVLAEDIDLELISLLNDGGFSGARVTSSSVREYETDYAAHILGHVGHFATKEEFEAMPDTYQWDDLVGKSGAELAFESYLKGTDGRRVVSTNADGKVTGEFYSTEPQPGGTVELTIDLEFQQAVEDALAETLSRMNAEDHNETRGAGAAVLKVGTGEVLALASYPTFQLSTYGENVAALGSDPRRPLFNRATQGRYAPGSTFKPLMAVAALETGKVTLTEKIRDPGNWRYPEVIAGAEVPPFWCWNHSGHGKVNVVEAIKVSCNTFFYEMGYRLGIETMNEYARAFGLGEKTGIEINDAPGILAGPEEREAGGGVWYGGDTVAAAIGQSDNLFTPIQLANYIATLVGGGKLYDAHLLKAVKSYDNSEVLAVGAAAPRSTVEISESTLAAVKEGMHELTTTGSLAGYFRSCVVDAGAKTGTAQLGAGKTNNGVFVCFAPYDDPEIALAIVIEHGGSGAALASTAVNILNAYFTADEIGTAVVGEHQLLP